MIPPGTPWLTDPDAQAVCRVLTDAGHEVYFVGGCVRDALLGRASGDIDLSTDAHPDVVMALARAAGFKAVPTGITHGTVTIVAGGAPFEVTTFRCDVETDGRRAVVRYAQTLEQDAQRRDFTMNALYATPQGAVVDPVGGIQDLTARRIRFIGTAADRIREDYLRTLRFFRFQAWFGDPCAGPDADALDAIARHLDGLAQLSGERVGGEMLKMLSAADPAPAVAAMRQVGVLQRVLPGADDRWLAPMVHFESVLGQGPDKIARLAALGGEDVQNRLRLSRDQIRTYDLLRDVAYGGQGLPEIAYRHGLDIAVQTLLLRAAMAEQTPRSDVIETLSKAALARFPVTAHDLMPELQGVELGAALRHLEDLWIASDFCLSANVLLAKLKN